ncbi:MAG: 50S ribosomal protein L3 [Planctomycetota bacterium]
MKGILGKKLGMTQIFNENGVEIPVTAVLAGPCMILQKKTQEKESYNAVQLGFEDKREKNTTKQLQGHFKKAKSSPKRFVRELRLSAEELQNYEVGKELRCDIFKEGERVNVIGKQKGRGFQGVFRKFKFSGNVASHGAHEVMRHPGAVGQHTYPARLWKGKKLPGQMGGNRCTLVNGKIIKVLLDENILLIEGGLPGARNDYVMIIDKKNK